jgi:prepilin-type N-terminal cleavage/methylation domain-containing protein/prepilin-type processing-associated H-X9-DG protein
MNRNRRRGFTLVELLVVVGIIAVLIGILLPALNRAREHAKKVVCTVNLRNLGQALGHYVTQWRHYPGGVTVHSYGIWNARLRPYLGGDQRVFYCPSRDSSFESLEIVSTDIRWPEAFGYRLGEVPPNVGHPFSYGYNGAGTEIRYAGRGLGTNIALFPEDYNSEHTALEVKASRVRVPSDMIAITDSGKFSPPVQTCLTIPLTWDPPIPDARTLYMNGPSPVHSGGTNVLFCDGHVDWYYTKDILIQDRDRVAAGEPPLTNRDKAVARMWNRDHEP